MKLKKLHIVNIASIQEATIDFDDAPLRDERLFLISGVTGAGKSTIIDCLCLALYGTTPRMKAARGADYENRRDKVAESIRTNDPRQLLRRGTGTADVSLSFEDNDGVPYIATWHVHRAHNRPDGAIQPVSRTLKTQDGYTPALYLGNKGEIDAFITRLTGLDVNQFLRTVVLAQGKFAEFLESNENEKSLLLEKMMGTEVYSLVGKKIHETCFDKKNKRDNLRTLISSITLLKPEETVTITEEINDLKQQQSSVQQQHDKAKAMREWLGNKDKIEQELERQQQRLQGLRQQMQEQTFASQRQLINEWDATTEERSALRQLTAAQDAINALEKQRPSLQREFDLLCAALRATVRDINAKQERLNEVNDAIRQEEPNSAMYAAIGQIKSTMSRRKTAKDNITEFGKALKTEKDKLPKAEQQVRQAEEARNRQKEKTRQAQEHLDELDVQGTNARKDQLNAAKEAVTALKALLGDITRCENTIGNHRQELNNQQQTVNTESATIDAERNLVNNLRQAAASQKDLKTLVEQAHKSLHEGDTCPICGQVIQTLQPAKANSVLEQLESQLRQAEEDLKQKETRIATAGKIIKRTQQQLQEADKDLKRLNTDRSKQWETTRQQLDACGKPCEAITDSRRADAAIEDINTDFEKLNGILREAQTASEAIKRENDQLTKDANALHEAQVDLINVKNSIDKQAQALEASETLFNELTDELDRLIVERDWQQRCADDADGFTNAIQQRADQYQQWTQTALQLQRDVEKQQSALPVMEECKRNISGFDDSANESDDIPQGLDALWRALENKCLEWNAALTLQRESASKSQQQLNDSLQNNVQMTLEKLKTLCSVSNEEIARIRKEQQDLTDQAHQLQGEVTSMLKQQEQHLAQRPDCEEKDPAKLDCIIDDTAGRIDTLSKEIVDREVKLRNDDNNRKTVGQQQAQLEQAEKVYQQWMVFSDMLGNADGAKFRKIALSYILGELLIIANRYLKQFNARYELEPNPGTLTILIRDTLQGEQTAVTTLSGGENFMVSLALALGLSSMTGKVFAVDTIFIDEGFGALSAEYLDNVMETLNRLYDIGGRRVGIISHVEILKERIPTQIQVYRDPGNNTVSHIKLKG